MRLLIEGWRASNQSLAIVNQFQALALLRRSDVTLFHRDLPTLLDTWASTSNRPGFPAEDAARLDAIPSYAGEPVDAIYRIAAPSRAAADDKRRTLTFMVTEFGLGPTSFAPGTDRSFFTRGENLIVTPTVWSAERIVEAGFEAERIRIVPHGVDQNLFYPLSPEQRAQVRARLGFAPDETVFLNIGGPFWNKGVDILLEAFALLRSRGRRVRLVLKDQSNVYGLSMQDMIAQTGARRPELVAADTLGAISVISGSLDFAQMRELFAVADAYVSPYRAEGFNLPALEAIACNVPIVVTSGGATDDFCPEPLAIRLPGVGGALEAEAGFPPRRFIQPGVDDLVEAMDLIALGRGRPAGWDRARETVLKDFSWDQAAALMLDFAGGAKQPTIPQQERIGRAKAAVGRDRETTDRAWLARYLRDPAAANVALDDFDLVRRVKPLEFRDIVGAIEDVGETANTGAAIRLYKAWIASQPAGQPQLYAAWFNLGVTLGRAQNAEAAAAAYRNALALRSDFPEASINLGTTLEAQGHVDAALQSWGQGLQPDAMRLLLINNRARLLEKLGRLDEAEREMRRSLLIDPQQPDVIQHWVHVRQKMCQWPVLMDQIPGLGRAELLRHAGPLSILALSDDIAVQSAAARDWIERKTVPAPQRLSPSGGYRHRRIRLGYMSSDFCRHAMSYLIAEVIEAHDRTRFEVFGYCSSPDDGSEIRQRVTRAFDTFRRIVAMPDEAAARLVRDDEIDILIDLNGLTSGARVQVLRWRPAPIQATYLGFVGPVPLPELDYMLCDHMVVPPDSASCYQPKPLYIADNYQANDSKRTIGQDITRDAAGLPEDKFVFCCFSNHYKTTEEVFDAWLEILRRADNSVLWLVGDNPWARQNMLRKAASAGIAAERLLFAPRVGPDEYMARLRVADLFLDTFPYNAGTVASDAIRMGLPLVTLCGQSFSSRMASRLLEASGARQGIATSLQEYIDVAVRFATDRTAFEAYRGSFGLSSWSRQIGNVDRFMTEFETTLVGLLPGSSEAVEGRPAA
jgi:predicted O-linked N-acetylglucosamine transferase (SPINDLY family)